MIAPLLLLAQLSRPPAQPAPYAVDLRVTPTTTGARLRLAVQVGQRRTTVRRFAMVGERPMHLFLVGAGLDFFVREAPVQQPDGVFMVDVALPKPGPYMAIAEFQPQGAARQTFQQMFTTGEAFAKPPSPAPDVAAHVMDGVRVSVDASQLQAGDTRALVLHFDDASSGAALGDLQPLFGAAAQLLMVPLDLTEAIDVQADAPARDGVVTFPLLVPRAGRYKLWVQFQRGGKVSTASFVVEVQKTVNW